MDNVHIVACWFYVENSMGVGAGGGLGGGGVVVIHLMMIHVARLGDHIVFLLHLFGLSKTLLEGVY